MSNFEKAIKVVLAHEGGYVDSETDPGGETKYGISKRSYPNEDIKNLTVEDAKRIYMHDWWMPNRYDTISNDDAATKIFDTAVNVGAKRAHRFAQQALNKNGKNLTEDGIFGPASIAALNNTDSERFLASFRTIQADYYKGLVATKPSLAVYLRGWLIRAEN
jgi:lysozyme family protein